jgi:hypothetical protein
MSSAIQYLTENKEIVQDIILDKYRGLRVEELCEMNPEYSCVICKKHYSEECKEKHDIGGSCPEHEKLDVDIFTAKYDFK